MKNTCLPTGRSTRPSSPHYSHKLAAALPAAMPDAAFYLWARTPIDDALFAKRLLAEQAVTVLPRELSGTRRACDQSWTAATRDCAGGKPPRMYKAAVERIVTLRVRSDPLGGVIDAHGVSSRKTDEGAAHVSESPDGTSCPRRRHRAAALKAGFHFFMAGVRAIVLVNTGIAAVYWIEDPRPFWHPLLSVQWMALPLPIA